MGGTLVSADGMRRNRIGSTLHGSASHDREVLLIIDCRLRVETLLGADMAQRRVGCWLLKVGGRGVRA